MKKVFLATTALVSSAVMANTAHALTDTFTATIDVLDALAMSQSTQMNFGKIGTPGSSGVVVHLTSGGAEGGSTTATIVDATDFAAGVYKITGSANNTISISGANVGGEAGFTFTELLCSYDGGGETNIIAAPKTTQAAAGSGGKNLTCGAKLAVANTVTEGNDYAPDLSITVDYE